MNVRFLTIAQKEIDDAYRWYEEKAEGKGREFLDELDRIVRLVKSFPLATSEIEGGNRRCLLARFSYAVMYGVETETVVIIAVAHTHREPRYWIDRTQ